jgi:hypothetical protein
MKRYFLIPFTILLGFVLLACASAPPITPEATPTATGEFHPLTVRTRIEEIDNIVDVVEDTDMESLRSLINFTNTKCTRAEGLGGPPKCREGEEDGMPVEVLPIFGPEGHFLHKEDIEDWTGVEADGLYAIYEVSSEVVSEPDYPSGKYAVMFVEKENQSVISLRVDNGRVVRVDYLFDTSPEELNGWLEREASKVILPPVK